MRIKTCMSLMRARRERMANEAICDASNTTRRSHSVTPSMRLARHAGVLTALLAALALALSATLGGWFTNFDVFQTSRASNTSNAINTTPPQDCSARYAALLDLAELARRDGRSSEVVVRGLSDRGGAMSGCL